VQQNARKYSELTGEAVGIVNAALGLKVIRKVTFASIQSIYRDNTNWDLIIIDEVHSFSGKPESMYGKLLERNSATRMIGLTATPYRMDNGSLIGPKTLFTDIAYEISIKHLIDRGFLAPLISLPAKEQINTSNIPIRGFDYASDVMEKEALKMAEPHATDILARTKDRKHILIFCSGVAHAEAMATLLGCDCVHGGLANFERDRIIERFKRGESRYLTNCEILNTGFDFPAIDCIVLLRATRSTGLYVQMIGRGSRIAPEKANCKVLDYAGNIERHGPVDCIEVQPNKKKDERFSVPPLKSCDECGCVVNIRVMVCPNCNAPFPIKSNLTEAPSTAPILSKATQTVRCVDMHVSSYESKKKPGTPLMLKVEYVLDMGERFSEYLCFSHQNYAAVIARKRWPILGGDEPSPTSTAAAFNRKHELIRPDKMIVQRDGKFWRVKKILSGAYDVEDDDLSEPNI